MGKLNFGDLIVNIKLISFSESKRAYALENSNVAGTLIIERIKAYPRGVSMWEGKLTLHEAGDLVNAVDTSVRLVSREKSIAQKSIREHNKDVKIPEYSGSLRIDSVNFKIQSTPDSKPGRLVFQLSGENNLAGKLVLESVKSSDGAEGTLVVQSKSSSFGQLSQA